MKFTLINIANKMPAWVSEACNEFLLRINHGQYKCNISEIKAIKNYLSPDKHMQLEADKIKSRIVPDSYIIVLDEHGKTMSSIEFAKHINKVKQNYSHITLIIGGADGIDHSLKQQANMSLQLSKFTFSHSLARVVILEQLYRSISILEGHPYHRE